MGSTGDADRKRRHISSISPTAAAGAKKQQPFLRPSEDSKLSTTVLQFQNLKLIQKLEAQKVEYFALENKFSLLKEKQKPYNATLTAVNKSWEELVSGLESHSIQTKETSKGPYCKQLTCPEDGAPSPQEDAFLSRLVVTGATESSSTQEGSIEMGEDMETASKNTKSIIHNILGASNNLWCLKDEFLSVVLKELPDEGSCPRRMSNDLRKEVKNLRLTVNDLHLKHRQITKELWSHQNIDAKDKAELTRLRGELESTIAELEESNCELSVLKAEKDAVKGAIFPVLNLGSKHIASDRVREKRKDVQDMESTSRELTDQALSRLLELKGLHEERIKILLQLSTLLNMLKNVKCISSSQAYLLVKDQLDKSKSDVIQFQALLEKLQVEKDNLAWKETEVNIKNDLADIYRRSSEVADSRRADLEIQMQKQVNEKNMIKTKLEVETREPGRKEIIADFKSLVSSFPEKMGIMQSQLSKYKEAASDIHALRADVQSLSKALDGMVKGCEALSARSADQIAEIQTLQAVVQGLKESGLELKLILDMYRHESTDSRNILEARDLEYKAWAHVQGLKSSLDEHSLELRVKTANEAEAISQQRLAAAEAEIADLRQKSEASKRGVSRFSDVLKSKNEENEDYLSEIETIGQAYDDMQTQNQLLLQQITERDDYNIKLVLEGVRARQMKDSLFMNKQTIEREVQQANESLELYEMKASRIEEQLKICSGQVQELAEDTHRSSTALENIQKRLLDLRKASQIARESLEESQSKVFGSRKAHTELDVELERERFEKKRLEDEFEVVSRRASHLRAETEGSSVVGKLQQELREYKDILKCSICADRPKEVVITKCYHLFCNPCVKRIIGTRHRKCPVCSASFGANDVKPVYI